MHGPQQEYDYRDDQQSGTTAWAPAQPRYAEVTNAAERLEAHAQELGKIADQLHTRLSLVLRPAEPSPGASYEEDKPATGIPLADRLSTVADTLGALQRRLQHIEAHLAV